jgi:hypothetical protein
MPAIRDFAQGYHATTTYRHVECPMPAYSAGDLLLAFISIDDSAGVSAQDVIGGRRAKYVFYNDDTTGTAAWTDYTTQAGDSGPADWFLTPTVPTANDCIYFGSDEIFNQINVLNSTQGAATSNPTHVVEYWNGSAWATLTTTTNTIGTGTSTFKFASTVHAECIFSPPANWATTTPTGSTGGFTQTAYWIRWRCTVTGTYTTRPVSTQAWIFPVANGANAWRQLFKYYAGTTPSPLTCVWKIAEATEYDTTFFYVTAETADAEIIAIRDVQTFIDSGRAALTVNVNATNGTYIRTTGSWATDGFAVGMQILPSGNTTAANNRVRQISSISTTSNANDTITVTDTTGMVTESGGGDERIIAWPFNSNITGGGAGSTFDGYTNSNDNTYRSNLPTVTTTKDDCLIVWAANPDAVTVPSIIEGPCQLIAGKDGSAHSDGMAWGYQKTAGATPSTVYVTKMAALVTEMAVVAVNPPHGGATVRPAYGISDASVYISPLTGAAYGSDSLPDNTLTTAFTGTINGRPVANGGATVTRADSGINSYHAMHNFTGVVTAGTYAGTRTVIASRNLASKNLLFHIQPYLPVDIQTTDNVALLGAMGVAIGLASSNGNFKVWHVGGAGVYGDTQRHQPVVIHTDATAGLLQSTGSPSFSGVVALGFMVSGKVVAPNWLVASMWALDTFTLVGGIAAEPITLPKIIECYAAGHERRSAVQQGSKQALFLGPVQIGDGTNFTYLNLDGVAVEFPKQYSKTTKEVYYNSIDNVCGWKFYAASGDTFICKNSVFSSGSRFFWSLHASFSTAVTPDFSGTSVIGAGTISLARAVTIAGLTINDYSTLDVTGLTLNGSTIKNPPATSASITTGTTARLGTCAIDVSSVTAGNHWWSGSDPSLIFQNCTFVGGGGHALNITIAGGNSITLTGNTWTGFGADASTGAALNFTAATGTITVNIAGGGIPTYKSAGATITFVNAKTVKVTVKDASTGAVIENARVLVEADTGGDLSVDTDILTGLTDSSGVLQTTTFNYTNPQPVKGWARRASTGYGTLYKQGPISGTITTTGLDVTVLLISDE